MENLSEISGLPITFDEKNFILEFNGDFPFIKKIEKNLKELRQYLKDSEAGSAETENRPNPVYQVWRYAHLKQDNEKIKSNNLRYDLTLMPPGKINDEFIKTAGHYHKLYPEIYEVLYGQAYFLIQSESAVYLVEASRGEKLLIPPFFGHNVINAFGNPLILADWISEKAVNDYEPYKNHRGAMYYFLSNADSIDIVKNPSYDFIPEIQRIKAKEYPEFGLIKNQPLYKLIDNPEKLKFLNYPEKFELKI